MTSFANKRSVYLRSSVYLTLILLALVSIGIVWIYSSSAIFAERYYGNSAYFLIRQLVAFALGLLLFRIATQLHYTHYKSLTPFLMILTITLMLLVLIPGIGKQVGNARRWIRFMGVGFQPSELLKFTLIIWSARFLDRKKEVLGYFSRGLLPSLIVMSIFCFLL